MTAASKLDMDYNIIVIFLCVTKKQLLLVIGYY